MQSKWLLLVGVVAAVGVALALMLNQGISTSSGRIERGGDRRKLEIDFSGERSSGVDARHGSSLGRGSRSGRRSFKAKLTREACFPTRPEASRLMPTFI